jgi:hypothetical protein
VRNRMPLRESDVIRTARGPGQNVAISAACRDSHARFRLQAEDRYS